MDDYLEAMAIAATYDEDTAYNKEHGYYEKDHSVAIVVSLAAVVLGAIVVGPEIYKAAKKKIRNRKIQKEQ